jgi:hypothetical protein
MDEEKASFQGSGTLFARIRRRKFQPRLREGE